MPDDNYSSPPEPKARSRHGQRWIRRVHSADFCATEDKRQQGGDTQSKFRDHGM